MVGGLADEGHVPDHRLDLLDEPSFPRNSCLHVSFLYLKPSALSACLPSLCRTTPRAGGA